MGLRHGAGTAGHGGSAGGASATTGEVGPAERRRARGGAGRRAAPADDAAPTTAVVPVAVPVTASVAEHPARGRQMSPRRANRRRMERWWAGRWWRTVLATLVASAVALPLAGAARPETPAPAPAATAPPTAATLETVHAAHRANAREAARTAADHGDRQRASADQLAEAVRVVAAGDALLAPGITRRLIAEFSRLAPEPRTPLKERVGDLTERETEVLALIARGLSNAEIAVRLVVAEQTVKTHVGRILVKLGLRDRTQAAVFAYESGLVRPSGY
ncbi:helix-turn-helix transcriptional regulator [Streptomyces viridosporus]|uniref:helix-turn-helix transcriptional regulator n=1 Tax=Streptomyces viridosporus TaxID=67581 RepID=UPI0002F94FB7|nr:response regulator transcription factor [Streptomyces viridosporus]